MITEIAQRHTLSAAALADRAGGPMPARADDYVTIEDVWVVAKPGERILRELREANPLVRALWMGADGMYEVHGGELVKISGPVFVEGAPQTVQWSHAGDPANWDVAPVGVYSPPEHQDKPHHFLRHKSGAQWIATWYCESCWLLPGHDRTFDPDCDFLAGWAYLGPAVWIAPDASALSPREVQDAAIGCIARRG